MRGPIKYLYHRWARYILYKRSISQIHSRLMIPTGPDLPCKRCLVGAGSPLARQRVRGEVVTALSPGITSWCWPSVKPTTSKTARVTGRLNTCYCRHDLSLVPTWPPADCSIGGTHLSLSELTAGRLGGGEGSRSPLAPLAKNNLLMYST